MSFLPLRRTNFTADKALTELGTTYKVYLRDTAPIRAIAHRDLTKNQEIILKKRLTITSGGCVVYIFAVEFRD